MLLVIWKMKINTTLRIHITPVKMAKRNWIIDKKWLKGFVVEKETFIQFWWDFKCEITIKVIVKNYPTSKKKSNKWPKSTTLRLMTIWFNILFCKHLFSHIHWCSTHNSKEVERSEMTFSLWMNKEYVVPHTI